MKKISLLFSLCLILSGCHQYYYTPSIQNVPLFKEKNEFNLSGSYSVGNESESGELQTAYSITNHLGIAANFMRTKIGNYAKEDFVSGTTYDIAVGYYRALGSNAVFEVYGGYGRNRQHHGYSHSEHDTPTGDLYYVSDGDAYLKYRKFYIQPAVGLATDYFDIAGSFRINGLWYNYINYDPTINQEDILIMDGLDDQLHFIVEPAITIRTGWRYIKFQFQASYAEYLNDSDEEDDLFDFVEGPHISCGFYLTLSQRWNKQK